MRIDGETKRRKGYHKLYTPSYNPVMFLPVSTVTSDHSSETHAGDFSAQSMPNKVQGSATKKKKIDSTSMNGQVDMDNVLGSDEDIFIKPKSRARKRRKSSSSCEDASSQIYSILQRQKLKQSRSRTSPIQPKRRHTVALTKMDGRKLQDTINRKRQRKKNRSLGSSMICQNEKSLSKIDPPKRMGTEVAAFRLKVDGKSTDIHKHDNHEVRGECGNCESNETDTEVMVGRTVAHFLNSQDGQTELRDLSSPVTGRRPVSTGALDSDLSDASSSDEANRTLLEKEVLSFLESKREHPQHDRTEVPFLCANALNDLQQSREGDVLDESEVICPGQKMPSQTQHRHALDECTPQSTSSRLNRHFQHGKGLPSVSSNEPIHGGEQSREWGDIERDNQDDRSPCVSQNLASLIEQTDDRSSTGDDSDMSIGNPKIQQLHSSPLHSTPASVSHHEPRTNHAGAPKRSETLNQNELFDPFEEPSDDSIGRDGMLEDANLPQDSVQGCSEGMDKEKRKEKKDRKVEEKTEKTEKNKEKGTEEVKKKKKKKKKGIEEKKKKKKETEVKDKNKEVTEKGKKEKKKKKKETEVKDKNKKVTEKGKKEKKMKKKETEVKDQTKKVTEKGKKTKKKKTAEVKKKMKNKKLTEKGKRTKKKETAEVKKKMKNKEETEMGKKKQKRVLKIIRGPIKGVDRKKNVQRWESEVRAQSKSPWSNMALKFIESDAGILLKKAAEMALNQDGTPPNRDAGLENDDSQLPIFTDFLSFPDVFPTKKKQQPSFRKVSPSEIEILDGF